MKIHEYDIGAAMTRARTKAGYSVKEMAGMLNMTMIQYLDYEDGYRIPSWKSLQLFVKTLDITMGSLFHGDEEAMEELKEKEPTKLTAEEESLLTKFRYLMPAGREEAIKRVAELAYVPMYGDIDYGKDNAVMRVATMVAEPEEEK